ncbi:MAG TPA: hypothetical protein PKA27_03895, partial [Fimbriimonadaceae bacterium]|nr:hypothetical protein [Fimbriimonadaceae bacterium]
MKQLQSVEIRAPKRDFGAESRLIDQLGVSSLVASILVQRGWSDPGDAERFLNPSWEQLHDPRRLPDYEPAMRAI